MVGKAAIQNQDGSGLEAQGAGDAAFMQAAFGHHGVAGQQSLMIEQQMKLDGAFGALVLGQSKTEAQSGVPGKFCTRCGETDWYGLTRWTDRVTNTITEEHRKHEVRVLTMLLNEMEALAHYQIAKMQDLNARVAEIERQLQKIEAVKGHEPTD